jgi:hypothetical protein
VLEHTGCAAPLHEHHRRARLGGYGGTWAAGDDEIRPILGGELDPCLSQSVRPAFERVEDERLLGRLRKDEACVDPAQAQPRIS